MKITNYTLGHEHAPPGRTQQIRTWLTRTTSLLLATALLFTTLPASPYFGGAFLIGAGSQAAKAAQAAPLKQQEELQLQTTRQKEKVFLKDSTLSLDALEEVTDCISEAEAESLTPAVEVEDEQYRNEIHNSDGTVTVEYYTAPVKCRDENGNWADIDSTLVESKDWQDEYGTKNTQVDVSVSTDLGESSAYSVSYEDYLIGFRPVNLLQQSGRLAAELDRCTDAGLEFSDTFDKGISKKIEAKEYGVKDSIILSEIPKQTEFSYEMTLQGAVPKLGEGGSVCLIDEENEKYVGTIEVA